MLDYPTTRIQCIHPDGTSFGLDVWLPLPGSVAIPLPDNPETELMSTPYTYTPFYRQGETSKYVRR